MNTNETDEESISENGEHPIGAHEAIMEATYRALCNYGAVDLTVEKIADEFDKSKSLIFYHFDSKEDLLSSFLAYLLGRFEDRVTASDTEDPDEQLDSLIDGLLFGSEDNEAFQTAMFELRSQAPFNDAYREQFRANRAYTHDLIEGVINRGIEEGVFNEVDAAGVAATLLITIDGARTQFVVFGDKEVLETTRRVIDNRLDMMLFAEGGPR